MPETQSQPRFIRFGDFEANLRAGELRKNGAKLKFSGQPFQVLAILLERPGDVVPREELQKRLWPDTFVDVERNLNTAVNKIREALGDSAENPRFVETLPRRGYRFIAAVETHYELQIRTGNTPGEIVQEAGPRLPQVQEVKTKKLSKIVFGWLTVAGISVIGIITVWHLLHPLRTPRVTQYRQITHDGHRKYLAGTDGSRIYFNFTSPRSMAQVSISGGETASVPVAVPGASPILLRVSPDGSRFLVESVEDGNYASDAALWAVHNLGGSYRRLGNGLSSTFSPDGNSVVYSKGGDLWIVRNDGTGAHKLASIGDKVSDLAWSPDGKTIRFTRDNLLWEINSSGSNPHPLLPGWRVSATQCCGQWSPDGKFFFFISAEPSSASSEIWIIDERGGWLRSAHAAPVQITNGPIRWDSLIPGKDGKEIFAVGRAERGELAQFDPKTKQLQPFLGGISADSISFSKDGKYVAFVSYPEGILWRANRDGSNPVQLSDPPIYPTLPRWSQDGTQIVFDDMSPSLPKAYIVSAAGGTAPQRLLPEDREAEYDPDWSPDGHKIVFESGITKHNTGDFLAIDRKRDSLSILDMATGLVAKVAGSTGMCCSPRWSPDGRYLAGFLLGSTPLGLYDLQRQHWSALPIKGVVDYPEWSADSRFIYFLRLPGDDRGVFRVRVRDGKLERVVDLRGIHLTGGPLRLWLGLDPTDAPLLLRDIGSEDVYALTLEEKSNRTVER